MPNGEQDVCRRFLLPGARSAGTEGADVSLMVEAGANAVRLAESAWAKREPEDGRFDFSRLDDFIELLAPRGIKVVLGTPVSDEAGENAISGKRVSGEAVVGGLNVLIAKSD